MGQNIRTETGIGTIPAIAGTFSGGTVTTDANKTTTLLYTGTDNILSILPLTVTGSEGSGWIYIAASTPKIARVLSVVAVDTTTPSALVYAILLDRAMPSNSGATATYIIADLKSWSCTNQGGADGTLDGDAFASGSSVNEAIQYPFNTEWLEPKDFNATGTSYLITENR